MRKRHFLTASAFVIASATTPQFAVAQDDAPSSAKDDVIFVTATRRSETVQDIPINIAAIGGPEIEEQGLDDLAEIVAFVPGINVVDRGGRQGNPIIVRGLNANPLGSGDGNNDGGGTVATYVGDIPFFIDLRLTDMERVEFLLGPQGTLYGAGTLGGAIRYIPNRPDFAADSFEIRLDGYRYSEAEDVSYDVGFTLNKRITDTLAFRASVDYLDDSGFTDYPLIVCEPGVSDPQDPADLCPQSDVDYEETLSGRAALRWQPIAAVDANLTYYFQFQEVGGRQISSQRSGLPIEQYDAGMRVVEPNQRDNQLIAFEVTADLGFAELTSASGYSKFEDDGQRDQTDLLITLDYSYETFPTFTAFTNEQGEDERINQEIRLVSTWDSPFQWIVGAFYNKLTQAGFSAEFTPGYAAFAGFNRPDDLEYFSQSFSDLEESAVFGELSYDITDRLTVTVGARYYDYELETFSDVDFPLFDPSFVARTVGQVEDGLKSDFAQGINGVEKTGQSDNGTLFKFNVSYAATDDLLVYGTVSEGYRIGDSNGLGPCPAFDPNSGQGSCALAPGQQFGPNPGDVAVFDERQYFADTTTNYEVGFKSEWADGRLVVNGAIYYVEWSDPQVDSATVNASIPITINASGAESTGFEFSSKFDITDNWLVRGSLSYAKTELTEDVPSLVRTDIPTEVSPGQFDFVTQFEDGKAGDRLPGSPETQFSVFTNYKIPLGSGDRIDLNASYAWQGDVLTRTGGRGDNLTLDAFGIARASATYASDRWSAQLYIDNLFDEFIETGARSGPLYTNIVDNGQFVRSYFTNVAPPRSIGVRVNYKIGG